MGGLGKPGKPAREPPRRERGPTLPSTSRRRGGCGARRFASGRAARLRRGDNILGGESEDQRPLGHLVAHLHRHFQHDPRAGRGDSHGRLFRFRGAAPAFLLVHLVAGLHRHLDHQDGVEVPQVGDADRVFRFHGELPPVHRLQGGRSFGVDTVAADGIGHHAGGDPAALPGERMERGDDDLVPIHLEVPSQRRPRVAAAKAVRAQCDEAPLHVGGDHLGVRADVVTGGDHRLLPRQASFQVAGTFLPFRVQAVPPLRFPRLARELHIAGGAEDIARHAPVGLQQLGRGDDFR